jgi:hypothetical protein
VIGESYEVIVTAKCRSLYEEEGGDSEQVQSGKIYVIFNDPCGDVDYSALFSRPQSQISPAENAYDGNPMVFTYTPMSVYPAICTQRVFAVSSTADLGNAIDFSAIELVDNKFQLTFDSSNYSNDDASKVLKPGKHTI